MANANKTGSAGPGVSRLPDDEAPPEALANQSVAKRDLAAVEVTGVPQQDTIHGKDPAYHYEWFYEQDAEKYMNLGRAWLRLTKAWVDVGPWEPVLAKDHRAGRQLASVANTTDTYLRNGHLLAMRVRKEHWENGQKVLEEDSAAKYARLMPGKPVVDSNNGIKTVEGFGPSARSMVESATTA